MHNRYADSSFALTRKENTWENKTSLLLKCDTLPALPSQSVVDFLATCFDMYELLKSKGDVYFITNLLVESCVAESPVLRKRDARASSDLLILSSHAFLGQLSVSLISYQVFTLIMNKY